MTIDPRWKEKRWQTLKRETFLIKAILKKIKKTNNTHTEKGGYDANQYSTESRGNNLTVFEQLKQMRKKYVLSMNTVDRHKWKTVHISRIKKLQGLCMNEKSW